MLNLPEYIVPFWLIPVLLQICLPLALLTVQATVRGILACVKKNMTRTPQVIVAERRENVRLEDNLPNTVIAEHLRKISGRVINISLTGICVADYPTGVPLPGDHIALYAGKDSEFNLLIQPRWQKSKQSGVTFGAVIMNKPFGWAELLQSPTFTDLGRQDPLLST